MTQGQGRHPLPNVNDATAQQHPTTADLTGVQVFARATLASLSKISVKSHTFVMWMLEVRCSGVATKKEVR